MFRYIDIDLQIYDDIIMKFFERGLLVPKNSHFWIGEYSFRRCLELY